MSDNEFSEWYPQPSHEVFLAMISTSPQMNRNLDDHNTIIAEISSVAMEVQINAAEHFEIAICMLRSCGGVILLAFRMSRTKRCSSWLTSASRSTYDLQAWSKASSSLQLGIIEVKHLWHFCIIDKRYRAEIIRKIKKSNCYRDHNAFTCRLNSDNWKNRM